jgi:hypothetical protein
MLNVGFTVGPNIGADGRLYPVIPRTVLPAVFRPWSPNYRKTPAELSGTKLPAHTCVSRSRQLLHRAGAVRSHSPGEK